MEAEWKSNLKKDFDGMGKINTNRNDIFFVFNHNKKLSCNRWNYAGLKISEVSKLDTFESFYDIVQNC